MTEFAELERQDIRDYWSDEAREFTPWLAEQIEATERSRLEEIIELELNLVATEHAIGRYNLDILAETPTGNTTVVIENQLTSSDHDHLGKSLVYGSGVDADLLVWIGPEFHEEHRAAVDWVNEHTTDSVDMFAIRIDVWQIGNSDPALDLTVVEQPNTWTGHDESVSETKRTRKQFWHELRERLEQSAIPADPSPPSSQNYYRAGLPKDGYKLTFHAYKRRRRIDCAVNLPETEDVWEEIDANRDVISNAFSDEIEYNGPHDENKSWRYTVKVKRSVDIFEDDIEWDECYEWLIAQGEQFWELVQQDFPRKPI